MSTFQQNIFWSTDVDLCWQIPENAKKMHVFEIVRPVQMVQWRYEECLAISWHYKIRGTKPICIRQQSFHFVNKCCLPKNLMKKISLIFHSYFSKKPSKSWGNRRMRLQNPRITFDRDSQSWNIILFNKSNFSQHLLTVLDCRGSCEIVKILIF